MALENKLGITDSAALAREEERISKRTLLNSMTVGCLTASNPEASRFWLRFIAFYSRISMLLQGKYGK